MEEDRPDRTGYQLREQLPAMSTEDANRYTFGIEEEFFLVDRLTRHTVSTATHGFMRACSTRLGDTVAAELQQAQLETVSPVMDCANQALPALAKLRDEAGAIAEARGLAIVAAGTHPLSLWQSQRPTDQPRYARVLEDFQILCRREVVCGMHVHVAVPTGDRVALMNRLMPWLPLFLALSTSSPFWNRERTGLKSYRQAEISEWPRSGIPDFFDDESDYQAYVDRLGRAGAIRDGSELWWAIRPSVRYPTLELRIADCCTRLTDTVALANLFRCIVRAHIRDPRLGISRTNATRRLIDENRWRAARYGISAEFIDLDRDRCVTVAEQLADARDLIEPDVRAMHAAEALSGLDGFIERGSSADTQLAVYDRASDTGLGHSGALRATVDWLIETTSSAQTPCGQGILDPLRGVPMPFPEERAAGELWL